METGFTIDDVRETLTRDVTRSLGRIERAAREILDDRELAIDGEPASLPRLLAIGDQSHAIHGTSRLVAAQSLADSSARMEALAHHGRDHLGRALRHLAIVRDIAAAMTGGATDMLAMLSLELDGQRHEAQVIADSWRLRVDDVLHGSSMVIAGAESTAGKLRVVAPSSEPAAEPVPPGEAGEAAADAAGPAAVDNGWGDFDEAPAPPVVSIRAMAAAPATEAAYSFATSVIEPAFDHGSPIDPDLAAVFADEARSTLDTLDHALAALRTARGDRGLIKSIERGFHTLKGAAATVGLAAVSAAAADLQDRAEALVDAGRAVTDDELAALVDDAAALRRLAGIPARRVAVAAPPTPDLFDEAAAGMARETPASDAPAGSARVAVPVPDPEVDPSFQQECADLLEALDRTALALERSERPHEQLGELLRSYHTLKGVVNALGLRPVGDQLHEVEDLLERLATSAILPPPRAIAGALLVTHGELRRQLRTVRLGYVELVPGRMAARLARVLTDPSRSGSASVSASAVRARSGGQSLGAGSEASGGGAAAAPDRQSIRVSIDRLDALMNLAGELVINRSRLLSRIDWLRGLQVELGRSSRHVLDIVEQFRDDHEFSTLARGSKDRVTRWSGFSELELDRYEDVNILARSLTEGSTDLQELFGQLAGGLGSLAEDSDTLGTIVSGIQSEVTRTRMVPLEVLFSRLQLPVRDAAQREAREVRIETSGADVHLDKTIVDALFQPMLHLVRNAVSHGIEAPHVRLAAGKPAHGTVTVRARQELGQIVVEVIDDGAGLDLERLRERGAALGLVAHDTPLDDPRIRELIFVHGLSTHLAADAVAGRGVGCDVVRRAIDRLNGSLRVDSVRHERTVFSITLPVTLAISRALLVRHAGETFAVPLYFTERIIDAQDVELVESAHQRRIDLDGGFVPVRPLGEFVSGATAPGGPILVLQVGGQRLVVQVDEVLTQEEVVVKSLGALLRGHPMFAGVTFRGTGEAVLILDVPSMVDRALGRDAVIRAAVAPARGAPAQVAFAPPAELALGFDPSRPLHVLFVDDSVSVRKVAERALKELGVQVTLATDGVDALDKLRNGQFDLVFTDLEMPRMHGYELIRELRFLPAYRAMPVVVVTSRSGKKHRDEAHALGASEYLTKPFTSRSLAAALLKFGGARARDLAAAATAGGEGTS